MSGRRPAAWHAAFLAALEQTGSIPQAAAEAGITRQSVDYRLATDAEFAGQVRKMVEDYQRERWRGIGERIAAKVAAGTPISDAIRDCGGGWTTLAKRRQADPVLDQMLRDVVEIAQTARQEQRQERLETWAAPFLAALAAGSDLGDACTAAGVDRGRMYQERWSNPEFEARVRAALAGRGVTPDTRRMLMIRLAKGASLADALAATGLTREQLDEARAADAGLDDKLRQMLDRSPVVQSSRWRRGERDDAARNGHNAAERERRAQAADAKVRPVWRGILSQVREGVHIGDAAKRAGVTLHAVYGHAARDVRRQRALDAALMAGRDPDISHGTNHSYRVHKCRCPECKVAHDRQRGPRT
ncbi:hypothetical protein [Sphaerimonospora thailandensis]|uniref:Uncharacterized protein n=1 Tax=Sphaerimonospora thailandensis TaxID=795644 RepID=A0A8J3RAH8_9ACTN|nr:hypothetical protein [Sphaerimonospora thailandensis]GIH70359.1 hypothetical protein Mth01_26120 [Sphaerimonospora thailandensis]